LGNAETEGGTSVATRLSTEPFDKAVTKSSATQQPEPTRFILFEQFQIELPPIRIGIMLSHRHRPVVPANTQSELPP
jgi:hypothetical protein